MFTVVKSQVHQPSALYVEDVIMSLKQKMSDCGSVSIVEVLSGKALSAPSVVVAIMSFVTSHSAAV